MRHLKLRHSLLAAASIYAVAGSSMAADGFKLRFPLSGTLGGEIVAPLTQSGFFASASVTQIELDKITDGTGNSFKQVRSGTFVTPTPVAGAVRSATYSGTIGIDFEQSQTNTNLLFGYKFAQEISGGHLTVALNLPYTTRLSRQVTYSGATPTLSTLTPALNSPPLPAGTAALAQSRAQTGFDTGYQAQLSALSTAGSGTRQALGDAEVTAAWVYSKDALRVVAGLTLAVPTGEYDAASTINVGFGNFYTLRPGLAVAYNATPELTIAARGSLGFNTRNKDNDIRSGDYGALDIAAAYRTSIGVFGPHLLMVKQFTDDKGGNLGSNRFSSNAAGVFFATKIPAIDAGLNLSYMKTFSSKNALSGALYQVRLSKAF